MQDGVGWCSGSLIQRDEHLCPYEQVVSHYWWLGWSWPITTIQPRLRGMVATIATNLISVWPPSDPTGLLRQSRGPLAVVSSCQLLH